MEVVLTIAGGVAVIVIAAILVAAGRWLLQQKLPWFRTQESLENKPGDTSVSVEGGGAAAVAGRDAATASGGSTAVRTGDRSQVTVIHQGTDEETKARITRLEEIVEAHGMSAALAEVREQAPPPQAESAHPMPVPRAVHIGTEDLVKAKLSGMSLDAPATVFLGQPFTVTVKADPAPDVEISGFASEVVFPEGLEWIQRPSCQDEVQVQRQDGMPLQTCLTTVTTLLEGAGHSVLSAIQVPPLPALSVDPGSMTTLVEMDFACTALGNHKLMLTAVPDSAFGAVYSDLNANPLKVKTTEVDGHQVADAVIIECVERPADTAPGRE